ncbi:MAG TPA: OsmC family protein [Vicinamibacterales bacterium]|nr:OsmC family protein [Vicinamibacterales bacterium]
MTPLPHHYRVELSGTSSGYAAVEADALPRLRVASPTFYGGPGDAWTPEHLLLASVEACFMFTLRAICAASKIRFEELDLVTEGIVDRRDGRTRFTEITLKPRLVVPSDADLDRLAQLMTKTERACLITASLDTPVRVEPEIVVAGCPA